MSSPRETNTSSVQVMRWLQQPFRYPEGKLKLLQEVFALDPSGLAKELEQLVARAQAIRDAFNRNPLEIINDSDDTQTRIEKTRAYLQRIKTLQEQTKNELNTIVGDINLLYGILAPANWGRDGQQYNLFQNEFKYQGWDRKINEQGLNPFAEKCLELQKKIGKFKPAVDALSKQIHQIYDNELAAFFPPKNGTITVRVWFTSNVRKNRLWFESDGHISVDVCTTDGRRAYGSFYPNKNAEPLSEPRHEFVTSTLNTPKDIDLRGTYVSLKEESERLLVQRSTKDKVELHYHYHTYVEVEIPCPEDVKKISLDAVYERIEEEKEKCRRKSENYRYNSLYDNCANKALLFLQAAGFEAFVKFKKNVAGVVLAQEVFKFAKAVKGEIEIAQVENEMKQGKGFKDEKKKAKTLLHTLVKQIDMIEEIRKLQLAALATTSSSRAPKDEIADDLAVVEPLPEYLPSFEKEKEQKLETVQDEQQNEISYDSENEDEAFRTALLREIAENTEIPMDQDALLAKLTELRKIFTALPEPDDTKKYAESVEQAMLQAKSELDALAKESSDENTKEMADALAKVIEEKRQFFPSRSREFLQEQMQSCLDEENKFFDAQHKALQDLPAPHLFSVENYQTKLKSKHDAFELKIKAIKAGIQTTTLQDVDYYSMATWYALQDLISEYKQEMAEEKSVTHRAQPIIDYYQSCIVFFEAQQAKINQFIFFDRNAQGLAANDASDLLASLKPMFKETETTRKASTIGAFVKAVEQSFIPDAIYIGPWEDASHFEPLITPAMYETIFNAIKTQIQNNNNQPIVVLYPDGGTTILTFKQQEKLFADFWKMASNAGYSEKKQLASEAQTVFNKHYYSQDSKLVNPEIGKGVIDPPKPFVLNPFGVGERHKMFRAQTRNEIGFIMQNPKMAYWDKLRSIHQLIIDRRPAKWKFWRSNERQKYKILECDARLVLLMQRFNQGMHAHQVLAGLKAIHKSLPRDTEAKKNLGQFVERFQTQYNLVNTAYNKKLEDASHPKTLKRRIVNAISSYATQLHTIFGKNQPKAIQKIIKDAKKIAPPEEQVEAKRGKQPVNDPMKKSLQETTTALQSLEEQVQKYERRTFIRR